MILFQMSEDNDPI